MSKLTPNKIGKRFVAVAFLLTVLSYLAPSPTFTASLSGQAGYKRASVPPPVQGQKKVVLKNLGMACPFCKAAVSAKLKQLSGVIAYEVDLKTDSATVLYDPEKVNIEKLKQAIAETGFKVKAVEELDK